MDRATDAAANPSQLVCKCGGDHQCTDADRCPTFKVLRRANWDIAYALNVQEVLEFGKYGPMAHCLRSTLVTQYDLSIKSFQRSEALLKAHPKWQVGDEISRLRRCFHAVADGFVEGRETWDKDPPLLSVLSHINGDEDKKLCDAKVATLKCYLDCAEVIEEFVSDRAKSLRHAPDKYNLRRIDGGFQNAFEKILCLPKTENAAIQELMKQSYDIWKESRRLLFDFEPPGRTLFPST